MTKYIDLLPDASTLIESQRSIGYTFETALADIIDNSISADCAKVYINFNSKKKFISILDDGIGMTSEELKNAMKYGSKSVELERGKNDLGRFGLGLKMASFSQCRSLTVISKKDGKIFGAKWDLDVIKEHNKWKLRILSEHEIRSNTLVFPLHNFLSGTIVIWEKFDKLEQHANFEQLFDEQLDRAELHLSLVFHRFIQEKQMEVYMNGRKIDYVDPFFTTNKSTQPKAGDIIIEKNRRATILVKPYIMPYQNKLNQKEKAILRKYTAENLKEGLYIYRNKRLIAWGKWFKLIRGNELANLAKIQIDIPNTIDDLWEIDVKKSQLVVPASIKNQLKSIIVSSIGESEKVYRHRGSVRNKDGFSYIFNRIEKDGSISYRLNMDNPIIVQLLEGLEDHNFELFQLFLNQIEHGLPLASIQYDMSKQLIEEPEKKSHDLVYQEVMLILENYSEIEKKIEVLMMLKHFETYKEYLNVLSNIEEHLNDRL